MKRKISLLLVAIVALVTLSAAVTADTELGNAKKLLYETARILESKNNLIVVDEVAAYDWFWVKDVELTSPYINRFNSTLDDNKSIHEKKERLKYLFDQDRSRQISALVPNALNVLTIAITAGDPLKSIIAVTGTALSSVTNYVNEKQRAELELIQQNWELDDQQTVIFNNLLRSLREYLSQVSNKYGFTNEQLSSDRTLRDFIMIIDKKPNPEERFLAISTQQFRNELSIFPEYWKEMATASYNMGDYASALDYIREYEARYVQTMYHDNGYANLMQIKAYCVLDLYPPGPEKNKELLRLADEITRMSLTQDWIQQYFCVELYSAMILELDALEAKSTGLKAVKLMQEILNKVADQYSRDLADFLSGRFIKLTMDGIQQNIKIHTDLKKSLERANKDSQIGKTAKAENKEQINKIDEQIKALNKNKTQVKRMEDQMLPPNASLLFAMTKQYLDMSDQMGTTSSQEFRLLKDKVSSLLVDYHSQSVLFGITQSRRSTDLTYTYRNFLFLSLDDIIDLYIPADWFLFTKDRLDPTVDKVILDIDGFEYIVSEYEYTILRGDNKSLHDLMIKITFKVQDTIETGKQLRDGGIPLVTLILESEINQDATPVYIKVDKPLDMLKTFKFNKK